MTFAARSISILLFAGAAQLCGAGRVQLPLRFEENRGQAPASVDFVSRGAGYSILVSGSATEIRTREGSVVMVLEQASPEARGTGVDALPTRSNYLIGNDRSRWKTNIPNYRRLRYPNVYPGIEVMYYGNGQQLEYDFVVAPGADPDSIRLGFRGASGVKITADGSLRVREGITWKRPQAYQEVGGVRRPVDVRFARAGTDRIGFRLGEYDRARPLVIDPQLNYSTLIGGTLADQAYAIAADSAGSAYVAGWTESLDLPVRPGSYRTQAQGSRDAFVAKLTPSGEALVYATYLGGSGADVINAIAVDSSGSAYVTGATASTNFPISANPFQSALTGASFTPDAFLTKLNAAGSDIVYSTYFGGAQTEIGYSIVVDSSGQAHIAGRIDSSGFYPAQPILPARGSGDAFLAKFSAAGNSLVYWTFYGGTALDYATAVALDGEGNAYVTGETRSGDIYVSTNAPYQFLRGTASAFVIKVNRNGQIIPYATYFGGENQDAGFGIAVDTDGSAYICGQTTSQGLPVRGTPLQPGPSVLPDAFLAKVNPEGTGILYSTYLGGIGEDRCTALAVDRGAIYVAAETTSLNLPVLSESTAQLGVAGPSGAWPFLFQGNVDGWFAKIEPFGRRLIHASYIGGTQNDAVRSLAIAPNGDAYVAGFSESPGFPTSSTAAQARLAGTFDAFVLRLSEVTISINPTSAVLRPGQGQQFTATLTNARNSAVQWNINPLVGSISTNGQYTAPSTVVGNVAVSVSATSVADPSRFAVATVTVTDAPPGIAVAISPTTAFLGPKQSRQFVATVTGTTNTAVTWTVSPPIGVVTATGLYTAPDVIQVRQTINVTAASAADPSKTATATVTLDPPTAPGTISIAPTQITLEPGQTQQFNAPVTGLSDSRVNWTIDPPFGTISDTGLYTAPASIPTQREVTVSATSVVSPFLTASAKVFLVPTLPRISEAGVAHGASALAVSSLGGVSPGLVVVIYGSTLGPTGLVQSGPDASGLYPTTLGGTRVLFDGVPAPMVYSFTGQVSAIVPYAVGNRSSTQLQVEYQNARSNTVTLPVVPVSPGLFTEDKSGVGQAAALNSDNSYNSAANPAPRGSIVVLFGTGEGQTDPPAADGRLVGLPLPVLRQTATATVGGLTAEVVYAGPAPGLIAGVLQVNVRIPENAPSGNVPVVVRLGTSASRQGVTVAVR